MSGAGGGAPHEAITFCFVAHEGPLELFATMLALSLREVYGTEVEIIAGIPEQYVDRGGVSIATMALFDSLGIRQVTIANPISEEYPIGNKLGCLERAIEVAANPVVVFLDTDMLALSPVRLPSGDWEVAAKPADGVGRGGHMPTWERVYSLFGLSVPNERMLSTCDREVMPPYFNAGFIAVRGRGHSLGSTWIDTARLIRDARDREPASIVIGDDGNPERRINHLDQFALSVAMVRQGLKAAVLSEAFNYPLPRRSRLPAEPIHFVHYHHPEAYFAEPLLAEHWHFALNRHPALAGIAASLDTIKGRKNLWAPAMATVTRATTNLCDGELLLLIVGLQKSGTTLMMRALRGLPRFVDFSDGEGDAFWGNQPAHRPQGLLFGSVFQQRGELQGHAVETTDMNFALFNELRSRYGRQRTKHGSNAILFNKNPYNTVRLDALKLAFPRSMIICMLRNPLSNVFSLKKKHLFRDLTYDNGWWGVKPPGWREILPLDQTERIAAQWQAVLEYVWQRRHLVDLFVPYDAFTAGPAEWLARIAALADPAYGEIAPMAPFENFDSELATGANAASHNREGATSDIYLPALTEQERRIIERRCGALFRRLSSLTTLHGS